MSILAGACLAPALAAGETKAPPAGLSVAQIVEKHVAARGGVGAWHAVQTLSVSGKLDAGTGDSVTRSITMARQGVGASVKRAERAAAQDAAKETARQQVQLPFRLEMKRPRKSRLEIDFAGKTAVQVYDGQQGWKLRPYLNRDDVEPFAAEEAKAQASKADLDPPLVDYAAKGTQVALEGMEPIEGHSAYKLKLTLKNGDVQHVWIDAKSFLDVKVEGLPRRMDGKMRAVWINQRDFRSVHGVMVPYLYETANEGNPRTHKMVIEAVEVNRALDDARFAKPQALVAATPPPAAPATSAAAKR
ncbi:MAG: outer membrane lipoprotein-sorting protein [Gammaproteobacteria bacterium]|nr:MAG: outer membrane lipoprotein-sorting protein [Gammaproteobacteria bacterium]